MTGSISVESLDSEKKWPTHMTVKDGDAVTGGTVIATVPETHALEHRIMVPPNLSGTIKNVVPDGDYTIHQVIATLTDYSGHEIPLTMVQHWPIRVPRPTARDFPLTVP